MKMRISPLARIMNPRFPFDMDDFEWPAIQMNQGLDVYEEGENVVVKAAVPGVPADKVEVTYEDGVLRIDAHHEESEEEKNKRSTVYRMERVSNFSYTTTFPRPIDANGISADVENGIVTVTAKIAEAAKAKKIAVTAK
jgi:HSP20 family protein